QNTGTTGLETIPSGLRTGHNSGYQAINLAVHLGARTIVLLGYDMSGDHFFGGHPDHTRPPFQRCLRAFTTLLEPIAALVVTGWNGTRSTSLTCFPQPALEDVIPC